MVQLSKASHTDTDTDTDKDKDTHRDTETQTHAFKASLLKQARAHHHDTHIKRMQCIHGTLDTQRTKFLHFTHVNNRQTHAQ
jgi:hypothetical protein